jgi:integrase
MRWDDITTFNPKDVHKKGAFRIIEKKAHKTKEIFRVPINPIVEDIINKHKYNFYKYENANFNKYLKVLLEKTGWFNDETKFIEDGKYLKRWECISIHRGRDSFCTMLINDRVPLNEIMKYTGHKHLSSLNKYINLKSDISNFTNELVIHE